MLFFIILSILLFLLLLLGVWQIKLHLQNKSAGDLDKLQLLLQQLNTRLEERERINNEMRLTLERGLKEQEKEQHEFRSKFDQHQMENLKNIIESLQKGSTEIRSQIYEVLKNNTQILSERLNKLTDDTNLRLKEINQRVEQRLSEGFEKTTTIFTDVIQRLALIDAAQKKITELSGNVINLQEILADKRSRGAFGEVQLSSLIRNILPENNFAFQYTLSNSKRADCILFLPEPSGNIVIDAKFPLENFQKLSDFSIGESERLLAQQQFRSDIKKHIQDIAEKYIIEGETADGAVMFIPAEAIFAEIHAHYSDLVELSHRHKIWMVSPTTLMAILNTARAVLKDAATRQQAHLIQEHLNMLSKDFARFQERMDKLAEHARLTHEDAEKVQQSSRKISSRFNKIEKAEIAHDDVPAIKQLKTDE